ncbi:MAG: hypothetical protein CMF49_08725 [Legionellales bacterium]|nr:hypothetical protein [Legionellales bacterium]|tara:strand:+ start:12897 stop:13103 length:207 start_codon:yes stop_codon:yes gene_type:complete
MDVKQDANKIYESSMTRSEKINQLQNLILDSKNELDAQEQNMRPEIRHNLSEGLRVATNYLRELQKSL